MAKSKQPRITERDITVEWKILVGKGDADVLGCVRRASDGAILGNVTVLVSKFRIDWLGYNSEEIKKAAGRTLIQELNQGKHKEITDAFEA